MGFEWVTTDRTTPHQWRLFPTYPFHCKTTSHLKRVDTRHNRPWLMHCRRIWCRVCSTKKKETMKFKCQECKEGLCAYTCFEVYHAKLHFWGSSNTQMEKQNKQTSVNTIVVITELIFLSSIFLMKNVGEWGVDFTEGALWRNTDFVRGTLCEYFLHFTSTWKIRNTAWRCL